MAMKKNNSRKINSRKRRAFEVLLSVDLQKSFVVEAADSDEAIEKLAQRWTNGKGDDAIKCEDLETTSVQFDVVREVKESKRVRCEP